MYNNVISLNMNDKWTLNERWAQGERSVKCEHTVSTQKTGNVERFKDCSCLFIQIQRPMIRP